MRGIDFREARARVGIAEVLGLMGYEPARVSGGQARGPCPLHRSRGPTSRVFAVHLARGVYHCFACGAGGNALDLWAAWTRQGLYAAVVDLYRRLGREVPWWPAGRSAPGRPGEPNRIREEAEPMPEP